MDSSILEENWTGALQLDIHRTSGHEFGPVKDNQIQMRFRWLVLICILLLLVYGTSPYFSFWRFTAALRSGDSAALSSRMDFPAIRASLKKQLVARFNQGTASHKWWNLGPTLFDEIIDAYVTPEGIAALISNPEVLKSLKHPQQFRFPAGRSEDWAKLKHAFFTGPRTFVVERDGIKLRFRFTGSGWKLYDLDLGLGQAKPIVLHERNRSLNNTEREIALWKQTVLYTQICEDSQALLFLFLERTGLQRNRRTSWRDYGDQRDRTRSGIRNFYQPFALFTGGSRIGSALSRACRGSPRHHEVSFGRARTTFHR